MKYKILLKRHFHDFSLFFKEVMFFKNKETEYIIVSLCAWTSFITTILFICFILNIFYELNS